MCFGQHPMGDLLAVECPDMPSGGTRPRPPRAMFFDGTTRDYPLNAAGRYSDLHPVDAKVQQALFFALGRIAGDPTKGNTLRREPYVGGPSSDASLRNRVTTALSPMVSAREVRIGAIVIEHPDRHTSLIDVTYENLITRQIQTLRF